MFMFIPASLLFFMKRRKQKGRQAGRKKVFHPLRWSTHALSVLLQVGEDLSFHFSTPLSDYAVS